MSNRKPVWKKPKTELRVLFCKKWANWKFKNGRFQKIGKDIHLKIDRKNLTWKIEGKKAHFNITIDLEQFPFMKKRIKNLEKSRAAIPKKIQAHRKKASEWRRKKKLKAFK